MSRGPGHIQCRILKGLDDGHTAIVLTHPDDTPAQQSAARRAAHTLHQRGLVHLRRETVLGKRR